uniref:Putative thap domain protein n=1 Tax=Ixodes ricinus TaxID=34613 RepID=A0A131Y9X7_IXORI
MGGCCAPGCRNATVVGSRGLRMFKLPKCPKRRKEWVEKINRGADWIPPKHAYLCEAHFEESMYLRRIFDGWMRLKTTAVPTIFQHNGRQHRKEGTPCFPKETAILPDEGLTLRKKSTPRKTKTPPSRTRKPRLNKRSRAAHAGWARRRANQQSFEASCSTAAYSKSLSTGSVFDAAIEE